jgi:glyoxylase-like metal-dependent hydrolase (beta-lactamase superfamily II)
MRKQLRLSLLLVAIVSLVTAQLTTAQQKSATEASFEKARPVLENGIKAMGGLEALQAIADITREMSGTRNDEGQGMNPVFPRSATPPQTNRPRVKSVRDMRGQRTYDELDDVIFGGQPLKLRFALAGTTAWSVNDLSKNIRIIPPANINNVRSGRFRRYPESLLLTAWNRPEVLRWIGPGEFAGHKQQVISFADFDGAEVALYFDARTSLLTKTEFLNDDPVLGDIIIETVFSDWRPVEKVVLPFRITDRVGGAVQQDLRATAVTLNSKPPDSLFAMPEGYAKFEPPPPSPNVKKLADDVYSMIGGYNNLVVLFKDYVLVVEAGGNNRSSQTAIAEIKKLAPDKPIRYLVSTHFHFDHLSGVRSYIAEGTTIVTTPTARGVIERAAVASHLMRPDALSRGPKAPVFEIMDNDKREFDDGVRRVELYKIASPHVGEMIIAYLPKEKILFEADMLDIPEVGIPPAGDDTVDLAKQIERLGLRVETIVPVHGRVGTIEDLRLALSNRK